MMIKSDIREKIKKIKLFLFDLDGVLILNKDKNEEELFTCMKTFADKLAKDNLYAGVVTARSEDNLTKKLSEISNCSMVASSFNKVGKVEQLIGAMNLEFENILFIGDDMLDIPLLQKAGIAIAPSSARREVKRVVDFTVDVTVNGSILNSVLEILERYL